MSIVSIGIACIKEAAYRMGFIDREDLRSLALPLQRGGYGDNLRGLAEETEAPRVDRT
jgi:glucose-1-phosphate thymidylyltransferase